VFLEAQLGVLMQLAAQVHDELAVVRGEGT
jgi:hypothetical protein